MARDWTAIPRGHFTADPAPVAAALPAGPEPGGTEPLFAELPAPVVRVPVELLVVPRCAELYAADSGVFAACQWPAGHAVPCGPAPDARPYLGVPPLAPAVLEWLTARSGVRPAAAGCVLAYAAVWDATGRTVLPEQVGALVGLARWTVARHVGALPVRLACADGAGWRPQAVTR